MSYPSSSDTLASSPLSSSPSSRPPISLPWSTFRRTSIPSLPTSPSREWPQWQDTIFDTDIPAEEMGEMDEIAETGEHSGDGCRTKLWQSIHEHMNIRSETNRTRLNNIHRNLVWADMIIRLRYYKAQTAMRRTKKGLRKSLSPKH